MSWASSDQWGDLLKQVSRSFYLTLRILPGSIRPQIGLAYLLARATDTIADTRLVPVSRRQSALREMRTAIWSAAEGRRSEAPDFGELAEAQDAPAGQGSSGERLLLEMAGDVLQALTALDAADRRRIRELLELITRGQELDLARFGSADADRISALDTENELEEYTYRVAGCVGEFWTRMCRVHLFPKEDLDETFMLGSAIRFGKGLQLVNILRDLPKDLRQGRCYLPRARMAEFGLEPAMLLDAGTMERFRPLYSCYLQKAEELLAAGWAYTNVVPRNQVRIRLACAWPDLIGVRTLARLRCGNVLDDRQRIKISRSEIRGLILRTLVCYPRPRAWNHLFEHTAAHGPQGHH